MKFRKSCLDCKHAGWDKKRDDEPGPLYVIKVCGWRAPRVVSPEWAVVSLEGIRSISKDHVYNECRVWEKATDKMEE